MLNHLYYSDYNFEYIKYLIIILINTTLVGMFVKLSLSQLRNHYERKTGKVDLSYVPTKFSFYLLVGVVCCHHQFYVQIVVASSRYLRIIEII